VNYASYRYALHFIFFLLHLHQLFQFFENRSLFQIFDVVNKLHFLKEFCETCELLSNDFAMLFSHYRNIFLLWPVPDSPKLWLIMIVRTDITIGALVSVMKTPAEVCLQWS
jgi:hypothetical protein